MYRGGGSGEPREGLSCVAQCVRPEGVHVLLCVVLAAWRSPGSGVNVTLSVRGAGAASSRAVGVEGAWVMAVGMAPACPASEVAGFLCVPGGRQRCPAVWERRDAQGWRTGQLGVAWEGSGRKAEEGVSGD